MSQPYEIDGHRIRSSVSIGIAIGPQDGSNADDLLMAADLALYAVKASTRGTASLLSTIHERRTSTTGGSSRWICARRSSKGELELHYQPIIDLHRNAITGFEALARWRHPGKGMVPPAVFIPVAEDSGLDRALGSVGAGRGVPHRGGVAGCISRSPSTCRRCSSRAPISTAWSNRSLTQTGLAPHRLELEITERIFMDDSEKTLSTLHRLKQLGVRIAMDDFGTGYSSLSYLRSFPFDKIKVDRAFVSDLADGTEHIVIVQAVVSIARALGMTTTAEGVETEAQREFLAALGCDEAQGYLFSAPVPAEKLGEIMTAWAAESTLAA